MNVERDFLACESMYVEDEECVYVRPSVRLGREWGTPENAADDG